MVKRWAGKSCPLAVILNLLSFNYSCVKSKFSFMLIQWYNRSMDWLNKTGILLTLITLFLMGCATSQPVAKESFPSATVPSTSSNARKNQQICNAGEMLVCTSRHRVNDGRHGRKNNESQNCMCMYQGMGTMQPRSNPY